MIYLFDFLKPNLARDASCIEHTGLVAVISTDAFAYWLVGGFMILHLIIVMGWGYLLWRNRG